MDAVIRTEKLSKHYGKLAAVDQVSINVQKGEIYGFLGLNGAGKTTTIRMLLGLIHPTTGISFLNGKKVSPGNTDMWKDVGYLVEVPYSYPDLTVKENLEITLEANPGTFESNKFAEFRALGINRLSIGIQSFNDKLLKILGRVHSAREAFVAAEIAHHAGFENFNLDLMFGLPDSSPENCKTDVTTAISLLPAHISFYQLTLEPNTYFHKFPPQLPDDELIFNTQTYCQQQLADYGYQQYEVSAYSQAGRECRHNVNYWQFGDYLGIGAGAHGKITQVLPDKITRTFKPRSPVQYMHNQHKDNRAHFIKTSDLPLEFIMNNLRLKQGFTKDTYQLTTGLAMTSLEPALSTCLKQGLLIYENNHYHCSEQGWNFMDNVLEQFMT